MFEIFNTGRSVRQISMTDGQRVEKAHPLGMSIGLGTSPCKATRCSLAVGFMLGTADSNAIV